MSTNEDRESFLFRYEWYEGIESLPTAELQLKMYKAIVNYSCKKEVPTDPDIALLFQMIKPKLDKDWQFHVDNTNRLSNAGRIAATARWNKQKSQDANDAIECDSMRSHTTDTIDAIDANIKLNKSKIKDNIEDSKESLSDNKKSDRIDYNKIIAYWNEKTLGVMGKLETIDNNRRTSVRARIRSHGIDTFFRMIDRAAASSFMQGKNSKGWHATFDWCIKPDNFTKIVEGNYSNKTSQPENDRQHITDTHNKTYGW